jgi:hypothetical protein
VSDKSQKQVVDNFAQVSDDKLVVLFSKKVCIYKIGDGSLLFSKDRKKKHNLHFIENRYVLLFYLSVRVFKKEQHKLLVIDLTDLSTKKMSLDENVLSTAYLADSGILVFYGASMTAWKCDKWPFEKVNSREINLRSSGPLVTMSGDAFACKSYKTVFIFNSDLKIISKIAHYQPIKEITALGNDVMAIKTEEGSCALYNFRSGKLLKEIKVAFHISRLLLTPDRQFMLILCNSEAFFYHLNGGYVYLQIKQPNELFHGTKIWKNRKFAREENARNKVGVFDFEK